MQSLVLFIVSGVSHTISAIASSQRQWGSCILFLLLLLLLLFLFLLLLLLLLLLLFSPFLRSGDQDKVAEPISGGRLTFLARPKSKVS